MACREQVPTYRTSLAPPPAESREAYVRLWNRLTAFWVYGADRWMALQDPGAAFFGKVVLI